MMRRTLRPAILPASFVASRCALLKYAGTVMTASLTGSPRYASASVLSFWRIIALISGGAYSLPPAFTRASPFGPLATSYGTIVISSETSSHLRPMNRLIEKIVFSGFVTCWRLAGAPTSRWSSFVNATTDGVVRPPSAFGITLGSPPSITAMAEFVVPRSMPITFAIELFPPIWVTSASRIKSKPYGIRFFPRLVGDEAERFLHLRSREVEERDGELAAAHGRGRRERRACARQRRDHSRERRRVVALSRDRDQELLRCGIERRADVRRPGEERSGRADHAVGDRRRLGRGPRAVGARDLA